MEGNQLQWKEIQPQAQSRAKSEDVLHQRRMADSSKVISKEIPEVIIACEDERDTEARMEALRGEATRKKREITASSSLPGETGLCLTELEPLGVERSTRRRRMQKRDLEEGTSAMERAFCPPPGTKTEQVRRPSKARKRRKAGKRSARREGNSLENRDIDSCDDEESGDDNLWSTNEKGVSGSKRGAYEVTDKAGEDHSDLSVHPKKRPAKPSRLRELVDTKNTLEGPVLPDRWISPSSSNFYSFPATDNLVSSPDTNGDSSTLTPSVASPHLTLSSSATSSEDSTLMSESSAFIGSNQESSSSSMGLQWLFSHPEVFTMTGKYYTNLPHLL